MANNVNLTTARAVYAAIAHTTNNYYKFTNVGMIAAANSPATREIKDATNPFLLKDIDGGKAVLGYKPGTTNPRIMLTYLPAYSGGYRTGRTALGGSVGSNGVANIAAGSSLEFVFDKKIEFEIAETLQTSDIFAEPLMLEYLDKLSKPDMRVEALTSGRYNGARALLVRIGNNIMRRLDRDMMIPVDDDLITTYAAGVGRNIAYPWDNVNGTADAPITQIVAFNADGTPNRGFMDYIEDTQRENMFTGKPVMVGGRKMARYMNTQKIVSLADTGYRLDAMIGNLPVEWYYDARIDSVLGQDEFLMWDSGAAAMQNWLDHSDYGLVRYKRYKDMNFGNMSVDVAQYSGVGLDGNMAPETISLDMDVRVLEDLDGSDYPTSRVAPSMSYGVFIRPDGYFTSDNTQDLYYVSGVYRGKLLTAS